MNVLLEPCLHQLEEGRQWRSVDRHATPTFQREHVLGIVLQDFAILDQLSRHEKGATHLYELYEQDNTRFTGKGPNTLE